MGMIKYRIHEVAKDFNVTSKVISQILTDYIAAPKNHMQVLENHELDVIFEYMTQHNQAASLEDIFKVAPKPAAPAKEPAPAKEAEAKPAAAPAKGQEGKTAAKAAAPAAKPAQQPAAPAKEKQNKPHTPRQVAEKRVVDTRGGAAVNIEKYNEKFEDMAGAKANSSNMRRGNKEKINSKSKQRPSGPQASSAKRRQEERDKMNRLQLEIAKKQPLKVQIPDEISVGELASRMKKTASEVVKQLMKLGVFASVSEIIDYDTAALVAMELGCKVEKEVIVTVEERLIDDSADKEEDLVPRAPVVVVMGHVDHGKTSLLDYIRHANVVSGEAGGITQHIGAYTVELDGRKITFLDTPGHEAFTSMRLRGAQATDIAVLVVAADDGVMPQTIEAINHAKSAGVEIIVAINKMDKPAANPEHVKQQLTEYDLVTTEWGGSTEMVPVSAVTGEGVDDLLETILLTADVNDYRANPNRKARGIIIEAKLDKGRGPVATVLVKNGTLNVGDAIVAGTAYGRVRAMMNDRGERVKSAGPSEPVEVIGFNDVPDAGDQITAVDDEKLSRQVAEERKDKLRAALVKTQTKTTLDDLFNQISAGEIKDLNVIIKADVQGSVEAVRQSLEKLSNDEVRVRCIHGAVGAINESDTLLASTANAIIIGFNVRPDNNARDMAEREKIDIRLYRVIYQAIEEMEAAMKGMLAPKFREVLLGHAQVRQTFRVSGVGTIAGAYVTDGKIARNASIRLLRDNIVIHEGKIDSLKRFKDDAKEVNTGYECGIGIEGYNDIKENDVIECFVMEEIER